MGRMVVMLGEGFALPLLCEAWSRINGYLLDQGQYGYRCEKSCDVHHRKQRGKHYLDESSWMAVGRLSHIFIHNNPSIARSLGLLA